MFIEPKKDVGWIEVISGPMFSGKTEELIRRVNRASIANLSTVIFKPDIDNRYHEEHVTSHNGTVLRAIPINTPSVILDHFDNENLVAIDEAQFFPDELIEVSNELANRKARVIIAGLDMDHMARPFGPIPALLATAEYITKLHAICTRCGETATFTFKRKYDGSRVEIGGAELYEALCRSCYVKAFR